MEHILLSVIIPVYNVEKYIVECVESLVCDDAHHMEIILIDDGSNDLSGNKCDELSNKYPYVRCIHKKNAGVSEARNDGLKEARGKYIAFVDADDRTVKGSITSVLHWSETAEVDICFLQATDFYEDGTIVDHGDGIASAGIKDKSKLEVFQYLASRPKYPGSVWAKLFRRDFLMENGLLFVAGRKNGEDLAFVLDCLMVANSFEALDMPYYEYRRNRFGSASSSSAEKVCKQLSLFVEDYAHQLAMNRKAKGRLEAFAMAFVAYEYSIMLWQINRLRGKQRKEIFTFMKRYSWTLEYAATKNTRVIRYMTKAFGLLLASKLVDLYMCIRNKKA